MIRKLVTALAVSAAMLTPGCAESEQVNATDREAVEEIVHAYILEHPEVIEEALIILTDRKQKEEDAASSAAITSNWDNLYSLPTDYSVGPADAEITLVEFFDYRCGYCKRSIDWVSELPTRYDGKVRVVFKELPIFGGESETAALAALAAGRQGKYNELHVALMKIKNNKDLTDSKIDQLAEELGVDVALMRADMKSMDVQKQLADMRTLGDQLNVSATPTFIIGDVVVEGANTARIEALIESEIGS